MGTTGAYEGKFIDRSPWLKAAGNLSNENHANVADCLVFPVTEDECHPFEIKAAPKDYNLSPRRINIHKGFYTDVRECLQPELEQKSFFNVLTKEFQETVYDSYWKKPIGRVWDQTPMLPQGMNLQEVCFGKPTPKDIYAGLLISPPKSYREVMEEARVCHEMYKRTHNDYDPGEQLDRNYLKPYLKELIWGKETPSDPQGGCIKKVMTDDNDCKTLVSNILADYRRRTKPLLGKVLSPNDNINCVPENHTFGIPNKHTLYGARELMKESPISLEKLDLLEEFSHINGLRQQISKKDPPFVHRDFIDSFHEIDVNNNGCITLEKAYEVLNRFKIYPDKQMFENILRKLKIADEKMVIYETMASLFNNNAAFPNVQKLDDVPSKFLNYDTTNYIAHKYHCSENININNIRAAGIPPSNHVDVASVISPSIFTNFGLKPEEFFISRSPQYLRALFARMGFELAEGSFMKIWYAAQDKNGCVSVNSFYKALCNNCKHEM